VNIRTTTLVTIAAALVLTAACGSDDEPAANTAPAVDVTAAPAAEDTDTSNDTTSVTTQAAAETAPAVDVTTEPAPGDTDTSSDATVAVNTTQAATVTTAVADEPTAVEGDGAPVGEFEGDEQAAADAWAVVFDSTSSFDDKAPHLEDAEALRTTIEAYAAAGSGMGGISLDPTLVQLADAGATVTYDVLFGTSPAYTALEGEMELVDGVWVVSRDEFCSFMASARTPCPAG